MGFDDREMFDDDLGPSKGILAGIAITIACLLIAAAVLFLSFSNARAQGAPLANGQCTSKAIYDASTNGATELVAAAAGQTVYICGYVFLLGSTGSATGISLVAGSGTNCGTGQSQLTPVYQFGAGAGLVHDPGLWSGIAAPDGEAVCIKTNAGQPVQAIIKYLRQ